ncbi:outer membrane beta-barrel protein [Algoriphagus sediminis]|uniref:OmpW family outer membrane protein n=1 Tax=Algoriphagus sediminis TaxID=3057113 RepID=A0ABT7YE47_9BACT|nr:outer membrane beta-barrel protein [Algoriphagus sediminis]MDN3204801.1 OmpW family outer membrane protein [Algoriphagus sediminis]
MKKQLIVFAIICMTLAGTAQAQQSIFSLNYAISVPLGNTSNYIDQTSGRGFILEYQKFINKNWAIGGEFGHATFYKREENKVYTEGSASLSGIQYRYQYEWPIFLTANYYVLTGDKIRPYFGLGVGTIAHDRRIDMGIFTDQNTHWQFAIRPEVGLLYKPTYNTGFKLGVKYYNSFESSDLAGQSNLGINVGIVFMN